MAYCFWPARQAFGFSQIAYAGLETGQRDRASYALEQGKARLMLTSPLESAGGLLASFHLASRKVPTPEQRPCNELPLGSAITPTHLQVPPIPSPGTPGEG